MSIKHWIYLKRGLSEDPKHRAAIGECVWLFMHIIDRADWETGIVHDWRDDEEASAMGMPVDTLRRQRQKLAALDYIHCAQKQRGQDITIMEWRNPRDYGSVVINPRVVTDAESPSPNEDSEIPQGDNQGLNQGEAQVRTPTLHSKNQRPKKEEESEESVPTPPNDENMIALERAFAYVVEYPPQFLKAWAPIKLCNVQRDGDLFRITGLDADEAAYYRDRYTRSVERALVGVLNVPNVKVLFDVPA